MHPLALAGVFVSSILVGVMAEIRKLFRIKNGDGTVPTLFFILVSSVSALFIGFIFSKDFMFEPYTFILSFAYAVINTVLAYICVVGTAYGNMTVLITSASIGSLIIPCIYGIISEPLLNKITLYKGIGFLFAFISFIPVFFAKGEKSKSSLKFKVMCAVAFFFQGLPLVIFGLKKQFCEFYSDYSFVTEYLLLSAILTFLLLLFKRKKELKEIKKCVELKSVILIITYGVVFIAAEVISLMCVGYVPMIILSPLSFAIPIIVASFLDFAIHREKLDAGQLCQVVCAILSCICFVL